MRKFILAATMFASLLAFAETPKEAYQKHPNAACLFFKTPAFNGKSNGFDIERIAYYGARQVVAIKTTQNNEDVVKDIVYRSDDPDFFFAVGFSDGSALAIAKDKETLVYSTPDGNSFAFHTDWDKQFEYTMLKR